VGGDAASYGLFSGRLDAGFDWGTAAASGQLGTAVAGAEGRWLRGDLALTAGRRIGRLAARGSVTGFGLHYLDPFAYDAVGADIQPMLSTWLSGFTVTARPILTVGRWSTESLEGDLRLGGGDLDVERMLGPLRTTASAGILSVANGATTGSVVRGSGEVVLARGDWSASARVVAQRSPLETEVGGGIALAGMLAPGVQLNVHAGRAVRDPLFGTEGTLALSAGLAVRPFRWTPALPPPLVAVGDPEEGGRRVTFTLEADGAETVALIGDFTGWEPVVMERTRDGWQTARILPPGLHHFGFIVDGVWAMPPDAPGMVDDGWGRMNASVVVEP